MRLSRFLARRPRPAVLLAAGLATAFLGTAATLSPSAPSTATVITQADLTAAFNDGWVDGRADLMGDDNRDGHVDEDETGWDCATMGNRECGPGAPPQCRREVDFANLCATVAVRPAYAWTDADGTPHTVPAGRTLLARVNATPGTEEFAAALFALDTQWAQHNEG